MKLVKWTNFGAVVAAGLFLAAAGCSGGSSPTAAPSTPTPPAPTPTPAPPSGPGATADAVCRAIGYGYPKVPCSDAQEPTLLPFVEAAIDELAAKHPEIFNTDQVMGPGGYRVLDSQAYFNGMVSTLATHGVCASADLPSSQLLVKNQNEMSETYAILNSRGFARRGSGSLIWTCTPASFPLSPADQFSYVRTAFFGFFGCPAGTVLPVPAAGELPEICSGIVTATPKDANGVNTPDYVHGNDISWNLRSGSDAVTAYPALDGNIFNYIIQPKAVGSFSLCATIKGVEGCLNGRVVPGVINP
jgi:hypothetical protein